MRIFRASTYTHGPRRWRRDLPSIRFEDALEKLSYDFAMQLVQLIRTTTLDELTRVTQVHGTEAKAKPVRETSSAPESPPKRRGRPPKKAVASTPVEAPNVAESAAGEPTQPAKKVRKKHAWPTCSVEGCGKRMYPGSGKNRLCYGHHLDAGGKQSPLVAARTKKAAGKVSKAAKAPNAAKAEKKPRAARPKTIAAKIPDAPETKPKRKKRPWPTCSVDGCDKNVYMPSGARKMCYQHNLEHGGKPTPLAKVNKARKTGKTEAKKTKAATTPKAAKTEKKHKTIRRKKADKDKK